MKAQDLHNIFKMAWDFVKRYGFTLSEALKTAWANIKFKKAASLRIVQFYFKKVDGTTRQAFGTLAPEYLPSHTGEDTRRRSDDVQVYFDTEKNEWRCFKKCNLLNVAL